MAMRPLIRPALAALLLTGLAAPARAQAPFAGVADEVNGKLVKLFGSGGFQRLTSYGTGIIVSPEGHILTVASQLLDTQDLRVHLSDGRRMRATVVVVEPELDVALCKLKVDEKTKLDLPYFDVQAAAKKPLAQPGDWVLAFSNQFQIATRNEPMSIQRGVIAAYAKLHGRTGIFAVPYTGDVYVVDTISNNPGAAGGALTTRKGELLGIVGKELRNSLSETWLNYAVPIQAKVEIRTGDSVKTVSIPEFVDQAMRGVYKPTPKEARTAGGPGGYHGIVFVPGEIPNTPPYVEDVRPDSPAAKAGLRPDDLVVFVDGEPMSSVTAFKEYIKQTRPGTQMKLEIRRGDKLVAVELTLAEQPRKK
jgi:serine protease Do